jgi:hypothetical protein
VAGHHPRQGREDGRDPVRPDDVQAPGRQGISLPRRWRRRCAARCTASYTT